MWKIPLADIDITGKELNAVKSVLKSRWLSMGAVTKAFEDKMAQYLGVKHAFAVANGTAALHLANLAIGITEGDEVIVPSLTFVATANSALYCGAMPIFAEIISEDNLTISPEDIEKKITPKTKAIMVMHYGGYPCDMDKINLIAKKHNLFVIEDAAHAPGAEYKGKKTGNLSDIACFSFFSNKNLSTGEGGMVTTNSDEFAEKLKTLRSHGMTTLTWDRHQGYAKSYDVVSLGHNYRIDEIRSALGIAQLGKLDKSNKKREKLTKYYIKKLKETPFIKVAFNKFKEKSGYHILSAVLDKDINRNEFTEKLKSAGIQTSNHYPPVHLFKYYRERFNFEEGCLPLTEDISKRQVTLPLYPGMKKEDVDYIVEEIKKTVK